jgi:hypothetical protein
MTIKSRISGFVTMDRSMRFGVFCIVLAILGWGKNNLSDQAYNDTAGVIQDKFFEWTQSINDVLVSSTAWISFFEISSSMCIDILFLSMFLPWIYNGDSFRLIIAYAIFYGVRSLVQAMCVLPYPPGMVWIYPVVPSITVPFGVTSDFMPSGHVGFCAIAAAEFFKRKWYIPMIVAWFVLLYECFVMICARGHYSIDLFFGAIMAHYMHSWSHDLCKGLFYHRICIDKIVGPYMLHDWATNELSGRKPSLVEDTPGALAQDVELGGQEEVH